MRSATSYFNGALYRKTMARFWPLWAGYGVIWLFFIPLNMLNTYFSRYMSNAPQRRLLISAMNLPEMATFGLYLAAFFAILCAMAVFGYLYNSRSSCWFHALPTRREALFTTQYLAGLSFLLLPQAAVAVLTAMIEMAFLPMEHWGAAMSSLLMWLLAQSGVCLFFFSFAAFCAMFTGHILALPAFYCILNVLADVIYSLLDGLFYEFFFGYAGSPGTALIVEYLTPAHALKDALILYGSSEEGQRFRSPGTVAVYTAVGVALALVSLYVYRRRHAETAGDVVAIPLVRPRFKYGVSFCSGLCLGMFSAMFFGWTDGMAVLIASILVWTVIGCFAAEMLLKKSFRVFMAWRGAAVMATVMLLLCLGCSMDLFGVETRVPQADRVERLDVSLDLGYPDDSGSIYSAVLTDPERIQTFIDLHRAIAADRDRLDEESGSYQTGDDYTYLHLRYTLKDGSTLNRYYDNFPIYQEETALEGSVTNLVKDLYGDRELVSDAYGFEDFLEKGRLTGAWLDRINNAKGEREYNLYLDDYARELWDAVQADFAEGTIGVRYLFNQTEDRLKNTCHTDLTFSLTAYQIPDGAGSAEISPIGYDVDETVTVTLTPNAKHTLAALEETGIFEEGYSLSGYVDSDSTDPYPATENW